MGWGILGDVGIASIAGDGGVGDANRMNAALNNEIRRLFQEMGQREALNFFQADKRLQERSDAVMGDMDRASAGVGSTERSLTRGAVDRSKSNTANLKQSLASSGFKNSTIGANLQQGVNRGLERDLTNVSSQADRARSGIATRQAGLRAQVEGDRANLPIRRNAASSNRLNGLVAALQEMFHEPSGETNPWATALTNAGSDFSSILSSMG